MDAPARTADDVARRARRNLDARRTLCKAAVKLFNENGYAATSAGAIANAANYAERTFFRHFARKEDVIFYDLPERLKALQDDFDNHGGGTAWEVVRTTLVANATRWESADRELTLGRVQLFHREPALQARYLEICQDWENIVAQIMSAEMGGDPAGNDLRCRMIAVAAVGAFRAAFRAWLTDPSSRIADNLAEALDYVETGLLP